MRAREVWFRVNHIFEDSRWVGFAIKGHPNHLLDIFVALKVDFLKKNGLLGNLAILELNRDILKALFWWREHPLSNIGSQALKELLEERTAR